MANWKLDFEQIKLDERIGRGNFGEVYKGTYVGSDVAVKKLYFVDDDFMQKYIEREMDTLTYVTVPDVWTCGWVGDWRNFVGSDGVGDVSLAHCSIGSAPRQMRGFLFFLLAFVMVSWQLVVGVPVVRSGWDIGRNG